MPTPEFSDRVHTTWLDPIAHLRQLVGTEALVVAVDPQHGEGRRCRLLHLETGALYVTLSEVLADELAPQLHPEVTPEDFRLVLGNAGIDLSEADSEEIFYLSAEDENRILAEADDRSDESGESDESPAPVLIRALDPEDAEAFTAFQAANSADDLDEAFVELDHWEVVGAFTDEDELVAVATAYPWRAHPVADLGVLTSPDHRGQKFGSAVVRALSRRVLERGFSPQYRCERGHEASRATATSAGFLQFATLSVVR